MSTITFDTLKFAERIEKAGASRELAAAIAEAQKVSLAEVMDASLATKGDVRAVHDDILRVERRMDGIEAEIRLLKWMMGVLIAIAVANFAKQFF